jgi:hypothetical protein
MSCLGFLRSKCDSYWLRDAGTRLAGVAVALRIDSNRQILVRCPCRIEMDTWNEDSFFWVEGGEAGLFPQFRDLD